MLPDEKKHYVVMSVASGETIYRGPRLHRAVDKLTPGTCYGKGDTLIDAMIQATVRRNAIVGIRTAKAL